MVLGRCTVDPAFGGVTSQSVHGFCEYQHCSVDQAFGGYQPKSAWIAEFLACTLPLLGRSVNRWSYQPKYARVCGVLAGTRPLLGRSSSRCGYQPKSARVAVFQLVLGQFICFALAS